MYHYLDYNIIICLLSLENKLKKLCLLSHWCKNLAHHGFWIYVLLQFEYDILSGGLWVKCLISNWFHDFGRYWKLQKLGLMWHMLLKVISVPLVSSSFAHEVMKLCYTFTQLWYSTQVPKCREPLWLNPWNHKPK